MAKREKNLDQPEYAEYTAIKGLAPRTGTSEYYSPPQDIKDSLQDECAEEQRESTSPVKGTEANGIDAPAASAPVNGIKAPAASISSTKPSNSKSIAGSEKSEVNNKESADVTNMNPGHQYSKTDSLNWEQIFMITLSAVIVSAIICVFCALAFYKMVIPKMQKHEMPIVAEDQK